MGQHRIPGPLGAETAPTAMDDGTLARAGSPRPGTLYSAVGAKGGSKEAEPLSLGARVVQWTEARLGQIVPDGQCFALVDQALRAAGARSAADYGALNGAADYVWGLLVTLDQAQPGDILQFRDFSSTVTLRRGRASEESIATRPHHSAILMRNLGEGDVEILEQNAPLGAPVQRASLSLVAGTWPDIGQTTSVSVTGQLWVYRPQPAL